MSWPTKGSIIWEWLILKGKDWLLLAEGNVLCAGNGMSLSLTTVTLFVFGGDFIYV